MWWSEILETSMKKFCDAHLDLVTQSSLLVLEEEESAEEFQAAGQSISDVERVSTIAMVDLKAILNCMISYGAKLM